MELRASLVEEGLASQKAEDTTTHKPPRLLWLRYYERENSLEQPLKLLKSCFPVISCLSYHKEDAVDDKPYIRITEQTSSAPWLIPWVLGISVSA